MSLNQAQHWEIIDAGQVVTSNSPEELWECAASYFHWCDSNPIKTKAWSKSGKTTGSAFVIEATRPYTASGLCLHLGIPEQYFTDILQSKDKSSKYFQVVTNIQNVIKTQNLEYAMIGIFNPIITSKILNLEREEIPQGAVPVETVQGVLMQDGSYRALPKLAKGENEILKNLDSEFRGGEDSKEQ